jgi:hypothetical protein
MFRAIAGFGSIPPTSAGSFNRKVNIVAPKSKATSVTSPLASITLVRYIEATQGVETTVAKTV